LSFEPILLAPEEEIEEIYPYRRVWRTSWMEVEVLLVAVLLIFILTNLFGVLPADLHSPLPKIAMALLPLAAWLVFSYRGERRALQRRRGLIGLLILGGLAANGVAVPLEEHLFLPEQWLPRGGFFSRVLGYAFTVGFTAEFLKYAVLRYSIWPERITQRLDGVAYALAVSTGYAVTLNLHAALFSDATLLATALRVASITFSHLGIGAVIGFFLAELVVGRTTVFWIPTGLGLAALLSGLYYGFRGVAIVGGLSVDGTGAAPIRGLALAFGLVAVLFASFAFIIANADARMEALAGRREAP
jgi:RsiW-degrading membrane proteinase PrsW (M82 family)